MGRFVPASTLVPKSLSPATRSLIAAITANRASGQQGRNRGKQMFYATDNFSITDRNTTLVSPWFAIGFSTRRDRDAFVEKSSKLSVRAISARELKTLGLSVARIQNKSGEIVDFFGGK
jgi:hypothetical protein